MDDELPFPSVQSAIYYLRTVDSKAKEFEDRSYRLHREVAMMAENVKRCSETLENHFNKVNSEAPKWYKKDMNKTFLGAVCPPPKLTLAKEVELRVQSSLNSIRSKLINWLSRNNSPS